MIEMRWNKYEVSLASHVYYYIPVSYYDTSYKRGMSQELKYTAKTTEDL